MATSPLAGKPAPKEMLVDVTRLEREYYERRPDMGDPSQLVSFGTSGHRGSSLNGTFTEAHILAITQAICDYRRSKGIDGPLYMGKDTHALSGPAHRTALEVLAANNVEVIIQQNDGVTPTPVISWLILVYNRGRKEHLADGIVVTPSHNPPEDGGFKYNATNGGPADTDVTKWIQNRANELLRKNNVDVKRVPLAAAIKANSTHQEDFVLPYVKDLQNVIDMDAIRAAGLKLGVDPLGRGIGAILGADQFRLWIEYHCRKSKSRSDFFVYDGRSRWQNSHGLFEPLRDGAACRLSRINTRLPLPTIRMPTGMELLRHRQAL